MSINNIIKTYQKWTPTTWVKGSSFEVDINHATHGVFAEAGEIAGAYQKYYRGDYDEYELHTRVSKEIGGLLYYLSQLANLEGLQLDQIILQNMEILKDRQERDVIKGDGDNR